MLLSVALLPLFLFLFGGGCVLLVFLFFSLYLNCQFLFLMVKNIKFIILNTLKCTIQYANCMHIIVQQSSQTLSSCKTETLYLLNSNCLFPPPLTPGNHILLSVSMTFDYFIYFIDGIMEYLLFVIGLFHLA